MRLHLSIAVDAVTRWIARCLLWDGVDSWAMTWSHHITVEDIGGIASILMSYVPSVAVVFLEECSVGSGHLVHATANIVTLVALPCAAS